MLLSWLVLRYLIVCLWHRYRIQGVFPFSVCISCTISPTTIAIRNALPSDEPNESLFSFSSWPRVPAFFSHKGLCLELIQPSNLAEQWQQNRGFPSQGSELSYLINIEFKARKDAKVLLCMAAGTRGTPLPSALSKRTRTSEEHRGWARFRTFPPGSYPEAPQGCGREAGSPGEGATRPWRPRRSGATQWCRWARPRLRAPRRGGGRGRTPRGTVTLAAAGPLREPVVCAEILGGVLGSAPLLPQKHARHVWRSTRCGSCPLLFRSGARPLTAPLTPGSAAASPAPLPGCCVTRLLCRLESAGCACPWQARTVVLWCQVCALARVPLLRASSRRVWPR